MSLDCCWFQTLLMSLWIVDVDIDVLNTYTFEPKFGVVPPPDEVCGTVQFSLALPLQV